MLVVQRLAGILFQMQPRDADGLGRTVLQLDSRPCPSPMIGCAKLADLMPCGRSALENSFAVEARPQVHLRIEPEPGAHPCATQSRLIAGSYAGEAGIDEAHLAVRLGAEAVRRTGENSLALETNWAWTSSRSPAPRGRSRPRWCSHAGPHARHRLEIGRALDRRADRETPSPRRRAARSPATPAAAPAGRAPPAQRSPHPARFAVTVNTSFRYILIGSSLFSPSAKAADGVAGVTMASTCDHASRKSRAISARTLAP